MRIVAIDHVQLAMPAGRRKKRAPFTTACSVSLKW